MTRRIRTGAFTAIALAALLTGAACGQQDETPPEETLAEEEPAGEPEPPGGEPAPMPGVPEPAPEPAPGVPGPEAATAPTGSPQPTAREPIALPADFPSDVPRYPEAQAYAVEEEPGGSFVAIFETDADLESVKEFYSKELEAQGWTVKGPDEKEGVHVLSIEKGPRNGTVSIMSGMGGRTEIQLSVFSLE